ncbi:MAG: hypothetical protein L6R35_000289 [Caloplaca aegaea]|nr:MAG: hypothetical protein L6R35_000289 [Caloplaca aegaea]
MGKPKASQALAPYRDDDAASTSSAVPLQDQTYADDEAPPACTDELTPVAVLQGTDDDEGSALTKAAGLGSAALNLKCHEDSKGSFITYISNKPSSDPEVCQSLIEFEAQRWPQPMARMVGSHVVTKQRDKKEEKERVTDFDLTAPLGSLLAAPWARSRVVENAQKAYRGGIFRQVDPRAKAHPEAADTAPSLKEWCHRFCASSAGAKSFTIARNVTQIDDGILTQRLTEVLRSTNYRGNISITYPVGCRATIIMSDHWLNRYRHNKYIWWACVLLQLWIFTWPLLWIMTKRWEVFTVEWPCRIYRQVDGSWPDSYEENTEGSHEGQPTDGPSVRIATMNESEWTEHWRLAIQMGAESKKRGTLTDADRYAARAIQERARQRREGSDFVTSDSNGFLASAAGLLSGVQEAQAAQSTLRLGPVPSHRGRLGHIGSDGPPVIVQEPEASCKMTLPTGKNPKYEEVDKKQVKTARQDSSFSGGERSHETS